MDMHKRVSWVHAQLVELESLFPRNVQLSPGQSSTEFEIVVTTRDQRCHYFIKCNEPSIFLHPIAEQHEGQVAQEKAVVLSYDHFEHRFLPSLRRVLSLEKGAKIEDAKDESAINELSEILRRLINDE